MQAYSVVEDPSHHVHNLVQRALRALGQQPYGLSSVNQHERTVVAIAPQRALSPTDAAAAVSPSNVRYKVRVARTPEQIEQADALVEKMYGSRGYQVQATSPDQQLMPSVCLLVYDEQQTPVGTVTAGFGNPFALRADELYQSELDALRHAGARVMEMTRFAIDSHGIHSARIQAALFNVSYICGKLAGFNQVVIELNPRHVAYYERYFGFRQIGKERCCPRVNAPAVLLGLDFDYIAHQVQRLAGKPDSSAEARKSLYRHFLDEPAEQALMQRLASGGAFDRFH